MPGQPAFPAAPEPAAPAVEAPHPWPALPAPDRAGDAPAAWQRLSRAREHERTLDREQEG
jgi:hypothetical protein